MSLSRFPVKQWPAMNQQGALHIPRPVLTVVHTTPTTSTSEFGANYWTTELSARCDTPTRFTLLGQSGVIVRTTRSTPTTCQLSMTFCTLALLALVGMIVYMEGIVLYSIIFKVLKLIIPYI